MSDAALLTPADRPTARSSAFTRVMSTTSTATSSPSCGTRPTRRTSRRRRSSTPSGPSSAATGPSSLATGCSRSRTTSAGSGSACCRGGPRRSSGTSARGPAHRRGRPTADEIRQALGHLSFNQRSALVMRELEGRSYGEIGEILDLSVSAVETLIFRARRALREQLEEGLSCGEAEATLSKRLDGTLAPFEQRALRAHLRECSECATLERKQRAQRAALKRLGVVQLPPSLAGFVGGGAGSTVRGIVAGSGIAAKAAAMVAAGVLAGESATRRSRRSRASRTHGAAGSGRCRAPTRTSLSRALKRRATRTRPFSSRCCLRPVDASVLRGAVGKACPATRRSLDIAAGRRCRRAGRRSAGGRDRCSGGECDAAGPQRCGDGQDRRQGGPEAASAASASRRRPGRRSHSRRCRRSACSSAAGAAPAARAASASADPPGHRGLTLGTAAG